MQKKNPCVVFRVNARNAVKQNSNGVTFFINGPRFAIGFFNIFGGQWW
jgi:hypothetical protein